MESNVLPKEEPFICTYQLVIPIVSVGGVFGFDRLFLTPSECNSNVTVLEQFQSIWHRMYGLFIKIFLWIYGIILMLYLIPNVNIFLCKGFFDENFIKEVFLIKAVLAVAAVYIALQYSLVKRVPLGSVLSHIHSNVGTLIIVKKFVHLVLMALCIFILTASVTISSVMFPVLLRVSNSHLEAAFCSVIALFWWILLIGQICCMLSASVVVAVSAKERFDAVTNELSTVPPFSTDYCSLVSRVVDQHKKLWEIIENMNNVYGSYLLLSYFLLALLICIVWLMALFVEMTVFLKRLYFFLGIITLSLFIVISFFASRLTSAIYGSFQEVRLIAAFNMRLEEKCRVLDFMKRFGKTRIGISMVFFVVTKDFPVKAFNLFHSIFTKMLEFRSATTKPTCKDYGHNFTNGVQATAVDTELDHKVKKSCEKISENLHIVANEPSLACYRLQEHICKSLPQLVEKRLEVNAVHQELQGKCYDLEYSVSALKSIQDSHQHFLNIQELIKNAMFMKQQLSYEESLQTEKKSHPSMYQRFSGSFDLPSSFLPTMASLSTSVSASADLKSSPLPPRASASPRRARASSVSSSTHTRPSSLNTPKRVLHQSLSNEGRSSSASH